jgi:DNA-binding transcriptional LysR family regulator
MRFDLTTLSLVLAIAESRSITQGAKREHLALAAASKRVSDLETRLGVKLFERAARGVEPTEAGRALVRHVKALQASLNALESEVGEFALGVQGHLRIAANASSIAESLPPDLAAFSRAHPAVRISLEDRTSAEVQRAVLDGDADVGVFATPVLEPRLDVRRYRPAHLAVMVPRAHGLASQDKVRFEALLDFDIVGLHHGAALQEQMLAQAAAVGRSLRARLQVRGFDAIAQLVEADLGVAVMPAAVAQRLARLFAVTVLELDEPWAHGEHLIATRSRDGLPNVVARFVDFVAEAYPAANLA